MLDKSKIKKLENRISTIYKYSDISSSLIVEFTMLEQREAALLLEALSSNRDSIEYMHTRARLDSLVAAGVLSSELANATTAQGADLESQIHLNEVNNSRDYFLSQVKNFLDPETLRNPLNKRNALTRMVERGDSKEEISNYLNQNEFFDTQMALLEDKQNIPDEDFETKIAIFKFEELLDALDGIVDPTTPPDFKEIAKQRIQEYDEDGTVSGLIDSGATSKEVLLALRKSQKWNSDAYDFLTSTDVDLPSKIQSDSWARFKETVASIKDLDPNK